jgi:hypothetical protein
MIQCGDQMNSKNVPAEGLVNSQADEVLYRHEMVGGKKSIFLVQGFFKLLHA